MISWRVRGELTDAAWERTGPLLPRVDGRGRPWRDHLQVVNGVLWRLRTGAPGVICPRGTDPGRPTASGSPAGKRTGPGRSCNRSRSVTMRWAGGVDRCHRLHGQPGPSARRWLPNGGPQTGTSGKIRAAHRRAKPSAGPSPGTSPQPAPTTPGPTSASPTPGSAAPPGTGPRGPDLVAEISAGNRASRPRPDIWRLIILFLLTWPSGTLELHGGVRLAPVQDAQAPDVQTGGLRLLLARVLSA